MFQAEKVTAVRDWSRATQVVLLFKDSPRKPLGLRPFKNPASQKTPICEYKDQIDKYACMCYTKDHQHHHHISRLADSSYG